MSTLRSLQPAVVAVLVVLNHRPALAAALSDLQGAWATRTSDCGEMFRKKGRSEIASRFERCTF